MFHALVKNELGVNNCAPTNYLIKYSTLINADKHSKYILKVKKRVQIYLIHGLYENRPTFCGMLHFNILLQQGLCEVYDNSS